MLTEEELKERKNYLGGSDMPIIMGLSNFKTPYVLYLEKKGLLEPEQEMTPQQFWGTMIEPVLKAHFEKDHNVSIFASNGVKHPKYSFIRGNLDGWIPEYNAVWEAKCSNSFMRHLWGEEGSDVIPMEYLVQIATYCSIMNAPRAYLSVLIGGSEYREFIYERNTELESIILESAVTFWDCLQNNIEPEAVDLSDLKIKYKKSTPEKIITINKQVSKQLTNLSEIKLKIKELTDIENSYRFIIMKYMEDAECLLDENKRPLVTWKANAKGSRVFLLKGV